MHELGIAEEILAVALAESARHDNGKVTAVQLKVGVLRGVVPENLLFLFGHLAKGTRAEGAVVTIEEEPVRIECPVCGTHDSPTFVVDCPSCGRDGVRLAGGDSLSIVSLDLSV